MCLLTLPIWGRVERVVDVVWGVFGVVRGGGYVGVVIDVADVVYRVLPAGATRRVAEDGWTRGALVATPTGGVDRRVG